MKKLLTLLMIAVGAQVMANDIVDLSGVNQFKGDAIDLNDASHYKCNRIDPREVVVKLLNVEVQDKCFVLTWKKVTTDIFPECVTVKKEFWKEVYVIKDDYLCLTDVIKAKYVGEHVVPESIEWPVTQYTPKRNYDERLLVPTGTNAQTAHQRYHTLSTPQRY